MLAQDNSTISLARFSYYLTLLANICAACWLAGEEGFGSDKRDRIDVNTAQMSYMGLQLFCKTFINNKITVQTNVSVAVNIWMEHFRYKDNFWRFIWVIVLKVYLEAKCSSLPNSVHRAQNISFPFIYVILIRCCKDSLIIVFSYLLQILN